MRRAFTIAITVLVVAVVTGGCRQVWAHRVRTITITTDAGEGIGPFTDGEPAIVSGTAKDWGDTDLTGQWLWQCVGAPTTEATVAADCEKGEFNDYPQDYDGSFRFGEEFMRHIETARSGGVDCALAACSIVLEASGPYTCDGVFGPRESCWKDSQPGDAFTLMQSVPITFLRTPESTSDRDGYADLVDDAGGAFASRDACVAWIENYLAQRAEIHVTPSTGLHDGDFVILTGVRLANPTWHGFDAWLEQCAGTPHNGFMAPQDCGAAVDVGRLISEDDGTLSLRMTVARNIVTPHSGLVDCAVKACTIAVHDDADVWPYDYNVASTPITFAP